jgi:hypothetical protein
MTSSMKKRAALTAAVLTAAGISGCGGGGNGQSAAAPPSQATPTAPQKQALDTAQVLALAKESSETASPFPVDSGLLVLTDTSETSGAITVDGP